MQTADQKYKHFSPNENWGDFSRMSPQFLSLLDTIRDLYGYQFIIHCGYAKTGHAPKSYHGIGEAADGHVEGLEPWLAYDRMNLVLDDMGIMDRVGFGWYPFWNTPGWHLDCRGWDCGKREAVVGVHWVYLDHAAVGFKSGYHYNQDCDRIIELLKRYR